MPVFIREKLGSYEILAPSGVVGIDAPLRDNIAPRTL